MVTIIVLTVFYHSEQNLNLNYTKMYEQNYDYCSREMSEKSKICIKI